MFMCKSRVHFAYFRCLIISQVELFFLHSFRVILQKWVLNYLLLLFVFLMLFEIFPYFNVILL